MSLEAMQWAYGVVLPSSGIKATLVALANFADEEGSCFPGRDRLAAMTCQSPRTITRHLQALEERGLIRVERRHRENGSRTTNRYILRLGDTVSGDTASGDTGDSLSDMVSRLEPSLELQASPPKSPPRKTRRPLSAAWEPDDAHHELARSEGVDVRREAAKFREHATATGRRLLDWDAGFRQWLLHSAEFARRGADPPPAPPSDPLAAARNLGRLRAVVGCDAEEVEDEARRSWPDNPAAVEVCLDSYREAVA